MSRYYPPVTVTGNPVNFSAPNGGKLDSVSVPIIPTQDLHGYANPWPAGGGKNLLPLFASGTFAIGSTGASAQIADGKIELTGTTTSSGGRTTRLSEYFTLKAGTYIISPALNSSPYVRGYLNKRSDSTVVGSYSGIAFTISEDTEVYYGIGVEGNKTYNQTLYPQVESGSTITPWVPYSNICPISGLTRLSVYRAGKNFVGLNTSPKRAIAYTGVSASDHTDDAVTLTSNGNATYAQMGLYYDLPAGTYTLSIKATSSDSYTPVASGYKYAGNVLLFSGCKEGQPKSFTLSETTTVNFCFFATSADSTARTVKFYDVQLESGSTATTYESYNGNTYAVDWTTEAGTVYGGTLDVVTGELVVDRGCVNVSPLWYWYKSSSYPGGFYVNIGNAATGQKLKTPFLCSHAKTVTSISEYLPGTCFCDNSINIRIMDGSNTVQDWKDYINAQIAAGTPIQICYELATPLTYQLTPKQIAALIDQNYIWSSNNETISVVYALLVPGSDKYTLIVNGVDIADFVERDSYRTTLYPVFSEAVQTLDGVGHTALLRKKGELSARFNPRTAADTAIICAALLNAPCEVQYHCLQRNADVTALMTIDSVSALYLSRCLYCRQKWNDIDSITLTEL